MVLQELSCELYAFECVAGWAMQKGEEEEEEEEEAAAAADSQLSRDRPIKTSFF